MIEQLSQLISSIRVHDISYDNGNDTNNKIDKSNSICGSVQRMRKSRNPDEVLKSHTGSRRFLRVG